MTQRQSDGARRLDGAPGVGRSLLPLGSVVILRGAVKKLLVVSRGSIVEGKFFDYGASLYPEGMIDANLAYFDHDDILQVVFEGYRHPDDELVLQILDTAYTRFQADHAQPVRSRPTQTPSGQTPSQRGEAAPAGGRAALVEVAIDDDPFAAVRDAGDDDE